MYQSFCNVNMSNVIQQPTNVAIMIALGLQFEKAGLICDCEANPEIIFRKSKGFHCFGTLLKMLDTFYSHQWFCATLCLKRVTLLYQTYIIPRNILRFCLTCSMRLFFWTEGMFYSFLLDFSLPSGTMHKMKTLEIRSGMGKLLSCSCCTCTLCAQFRCRSFWDRQWNMCILQFYENRDSFPSARGVRGRASSLSLQVCGIKSDTASRQPLTSLTNKFFFVYG